MKCLYKLQNNQNIVCKAKMTTIQNRQNDGNGMNWCEVKQRNKPQGNALVVGIMMMLVSGMHVGLGVFNQELHLQEWTIDRKHGEILGVILVWYLAAILGAIIGSVVVDHWGKKKIGVITLMTFSISCIPLIAFPEKILAIAFARFFAGCGHGLVCSTIFIHGGEVVIKEMRGMVLSSVNFCFFCGMLTEAAFDQTVDNSDSNFFDPNRITGVISLFYVCMTAVFLPFMVRESPVYLIRKGKDLEAIRVMIKLRNEPSETWEIRADYNEFKVMLNEDKQKSKSIIKDGNIRPLILLIFTKIVYVLSFNRPLNLIRLNAVSSFFENLKISSLVLIGIRLTLGIICIITFDYFGRKKQLFISGAGSSLAIIIVSIIYVSSENVDNVFPLIFAMIFECFVSGIGFVPDVYSSEAFPTQKKAKSIAVVQISENVLHVIIISMTFNWDYRVNHYDDGLILMIIGIPMLIITICLYKTLPETNKISIRESRNEFRRKNIEFPGVAQQ